MRGPGLDQDDPDVLRRVDPVHAEGDDLPRRAVQFGGQFGAGGAGTDDGHVQLAGADRLLLGVGAQAGIHQATVEALGLLGRLQRDGEFGSAGRAEIIGDAAHGDHQRVVMDAARGA